MSKVATALEPVLLSRKQAAALLSISVRALDYLVQRGDIKTKRVGKRVLIHYDEIKRFARADHPQAIVPTNRA